MVLLIIEEEICLSNVLISNLRKRIVRVSHYRSRYGIAKVQNKFFFWSRFSFFIYPNARRL
jgi:hypothetical protein